MTNNLQLHLFTLDSHEWHGPFVSFKQAHEYASTHNLTSYQVTAAIPPPTNLARWNSKMPIWPPQEKEDGLVNDMHDSGNDPDDSGVSAGMKDFEFHCETCNTLLIDKGPEGPIPVRVLELEADRERLRTALAKIVNTPTDMRTWSDLREIAITALFNLKKGT